MTKDRPRVGFGILLQKENKVLLGRRHDDPAKASSDLHGEGTWTMPGGKLDYKEKLIDAAKRELLEETGIVLQQASVVSVTDDIVHDNHYVTVGFVATSFQGDPQVLEPDEIIRWEWFPVDKLPEKVYPPSKKLLDNYLRKQVYS